MRLARIFGALAAMCIGTVALADEHESGNGPFLPGLVLAELGASLASPTLLAASIEVFTATVDKHPVHEPPPFDTRSALDASNLLERYTSLGRLLARGNADVLSLFRANDATLPAAMLPLTSGDQTLSFRRDDTSAAAVTIHGLGRGTLDVRLATSDGETVCESSTGQDSVTCALPKDVGPLQLTVASKSAAAREAVLIFHD